MDFLKDRRTVLIAGGAVVALAAGVGIALILAPSGRKASEPPPASQGGLVVEARSDDGKLDTARPLRCFVAGKFVGEMTLAQCAEKNGVATGGLDVGMDETGALAAAEQGATRLTPAPAATATPGPAPTPEPSPAAQAAGPAGGCWRYAGEWRRLTGDLTLNACVQALFAGRCEKPGQASYGRWMQQTLRLVPGRIEVSSDERNFRPLAEQGPGCTIGPIG